MKQISKNTFKFSKLSSTPKVPISNLNCVNRKTNTIIHTKKEKIILPNTLFFSNSYCKIQEAVSTLQQKFQDNFQQAVNFEKEEKYKEAIEAADSALRIISGGASFRNVDTEIIPKAFSQQFALNLLLLGHLLQENGDFAGSFAVYKKGLQFSQFHNDYSGLLEFSQKNANFTSDPKEAVELLNLGLYAANKVPGANSDQIQILLRKAKLELKYSPSESIETLKFAINFAKREGLKDYPSIATVRINLAEKKLKQFKVVEKYEKEVENFKKNLTNSSMTDEQVQDYIQLVEKVVKGYGELNYHEKAKNYASILLETSQKYNLKDVEMKANYYLGRYSCNLEVYLGDIETAKYYLENAVVIAEKSSNTEIKPLIYEAFGRINKYEKNDENAMYYFEESLKLAEECENKEIQISVLKNLIHFSEQLEDKEKKLKYAELLLDSSTETKDDESRMIALRKICEIQFNDWQNLMEKDQNINTELNEAEKKEADKKYTADEIFKYTQQLLFLARELHMTEVAIFAQNLRVTVLGNLRLFDYLVSELEGEVAKLNNSDLDPFYATFLYQQLSAAYVFAGDLESSNKYLKMHQESAQEHGQSYDQTTTFEEKKEKAGERKLWNQQIVISLLFGGFILYSTLAPS